LGEGATPPTLYALDSFEIGSLSAQFGLDHKPPICFSLHSKDDRCSPTILTHWLTWSLVNFLPVLASNHDPPDLCLLSS
jgi:hypothetical protein